MEQFLKEWWHTIITIFAFVAWLSRIEMRTRQNAKDHEDLSARFEAESERRAAQRTEDIANLRRDIDGVNGRLDSIQAVLNELLQRSSKAD